MKKIFLVSAIAFWCYDSAPAQVFRYEYDLGSSGSGYDSGEGGAGYKSSDGTFYLSGITDISGDDDPLLIKINSDGTKNFVRQYRIASGSYEYISYGRLTADGGYLLYGNTDYNNAGDILLLKINATGGISWARELKISGATFISPTRFYELSAGGYVLTGSVSGVGAGSSDAYAIKISADGNTVNFAKAYGTSRAENANSIIEHSSGKISFVGDRNVTVSGTPYDAWWVELNSDGSLSYSKTIGGTNNDKFKDILETTSNTYMIVGQWCSTDGSCTGFPCSGFLFEVNTSGSQLLRRIFYTSSPSGKVFAPSCIYRTPDNNNYWIGGQINMDGGVDNNCLMIKTSAATPSPSSGYSIGDTYEENYLRSAGAASGNNEFIMGGTKNYSISFPERRSLIVKATSATQCDASAVSFSTCNWTSTSLTDIATTVTNLTITTYTLTSGTDVIETNKTSTTGSTQDCFLPVALISFSGKAEERKVQLWWSTASEENNDYFTIERSADGQTFSEIGKIKGAGNSSMVRNYEFTDENPLQINYYRLSQTDFDGRREEMGIISVKFGSNENNLFLAVQSNPVTSGALFINLFSPQATDLAIQISDIHGKIIAEEKTSLEKNETKLLKIDLKNSARGAYFITASSKTGFANSKFLLLSEE